MNKAMKEMSEGLPPKRNCCLVVDANNLAIRNYYAVRDLKNSKGEPTNAIFGFLKSIQMLVDEYLPRRVYIVWDGREKTWRHELCDKLVKKGIYEHGYKWGRKKDEKVIQEFYPQVAKLQEILALLGYFQYIGYEYEGKHFEADDVIGSLAYDISTKAYLRPCYVVSGDKDFAQLLELDHVKLLRPSHDMQGYDLWTRKRFLEQNGVRPKRAILIGALMGDSGDNIEGVDGIGEVTSLKIAKQYKTMKSVKVAIRSGETILTPNVTNKLKGAIPKLVANMRLKRIVLWLRPRPPNIERDLQKADQIIRKELEFKEVSAFRLAKGNMDLYFKA